MNGTRSQFYMSYGPVQPYKAVSHKPQRYQDFVPSGEPFPTATLLADLRETISTPQAIFRMVRQASLPSAPTPPPFWIKAWAEDGTAAPVARTQ